MRTDPETDTRAGRLGGGGVALVTGGSRGIGRASCLALAREGRAVAVNYRVRRAEADAVVAEIEDLGGTAVALQADVSEYAEAQALVQAAKRELGGLDVLVNNAGIADDGLIYDLDVDAAWRVLRVNYGGVLNCTKAVMGHFMSERAGVIVNVSSVMGERGWTGQSSYAAAKGAINAFTRCSAVELARFGVRVNAVLPGFTPTELLGPVLDRESGIRRQIPLRSFATVDQIAEVIAFVAGPRADYLTGELIRVDGGFAAQLGVGRAEPSRAGIRKGQPA